MLNIGKINKYIDKEKFTLNGFFGFVFPSKPDWILIRVSTLLNWTSARLSFCDQRVIAAKPRARLSDKCGVSALKVAHVMTTARARSWIEPSHRTRETDVLRALAYKRAHVFNWNETGEPLSILNRLPFVRAFQEGTPQLAILKLLVAWSSPDAFQHFLQ